MLSNATYKPNRWLQVLLAALLLCVVALPSIAQEIAGLPDVSGRKKDVEKPLSMGDFGVSIMYPPDAVQAVRQILDIYEHNKEDTIALEEEVEEDDLLADLLAGNEAPSAPEVAPPPQPNFYVGTIIYRAPGNWSIWVNSKRINSTKPNRNYGAHGFVTIVSVSKNMVTLTWKPGDLRRSLELWKERKNIGQRSLKHRRARLMQVDFDPDRKAYVMTMRTNQTFVGENMEIIEGRIRGPEPEGTVADAPKKEASPEADDREVERYKTRRETPYTGSRDIDDSKKDSTRRLMDKLVEENSKLQRVTPKNTTDPYAIPENQIPQGATNQNINDLVDDGDLP